MKGVVLQMKAQQTSRAVVSGLDFHHHVADTFAPLTPTGIKRNALEVRTHAVHEDLSKTLRFFLYYSTMLYLEKFDHSTTFLDAELI